MKDLDRLIGAKLGALRKVPVPGLPRLCPGRELEPRRASAALGAAAAMLIVLAGSLYFIPTRPSTSAAVLADRITALEKRIARVESEELRALFTREIALLRRELELSQLKQ